MDLLVLMPELDISRGRTAWNSFKRQWMNCSQTNPNVFENQSDFLTVDLFLKCIGRDGLNLFNSFEFVSQEDANDITVVIEKFDTYFNSLPDAVNECHVGGIQARYLFHTRHQESDECFDDFLNSVTTLAAACNFCKCLGESLIRDQILVGVKSETARQRMLKEDNMTLEDCLQICRLFSAKSNEHSAQLDRGDNFEETRKQPQCNEGRKKTLLKKSDDQVITDSEAALQLVGLQVMLDEATQDSHELSTNPAVSEIIAVPNKPKPVCGSKTVCHLQQESLFETNSSKTKFVFSMTEDGRMVITTVIDTQQNGARKALDLEDSSQCQFSYSASDDHSYGAVTVTDLAPFQERNCIDIPNNASAFTMHCFGDGTMLEPCNTIEISSTSQNATVNSAKKLLEEIEGPCPEVDDSDNDGSLFPNQSPSFEELRREIPIVDAFHFGAEMDNIPVIQIDQSMMISIKKEISDNVQNLDTSCKLKSEDSTTEAVDSRTCCPICGKLFADAHCVRQHQVTHLEACSCPECGQVVFGRRNLRNHRLEHADAKTRCPECHKQFLNPWDLLTHKAQCRQIIPVIQLKADSPEKQRDLNTGLENGSDSAARPSNLPLWRKIPFKFKRRPRQNKKPKQQVKFPCDRCGVLLGTAARLLMHKKFHTVILNCEVCHEDIQGWKEFKNHWKSHPELKNKDPPRPKLYQCSVCRKCFDSGITLRQHAYRHTGDSPFKCDMCGKAFTRQPALRQHYRLHTEEKIYSCQLCDKRYAVKSHLRSHIASAHCGFKTAPCEVCGKQFSRQSYLKKHQLIHTGEKPYECEICGKRYHCNVAFRYHKRGHEGFKPYTCEFCGTSHGMLSHLKQHIQRSHTNERPYTCTICNKGFVTSDSLKRHLPVHSGERNFGCDVCGQKFTGPRYLKRHIKNHHSNV